MKKYNKFEANQKIIEFLRFPIPKTPTEITNHLKKEVENFYPKSRSDLVIGFLRRNHLDELLAKNIIVEYTGDETNWKSIRTLMKRYYNGQKAAPPRKVSSLFQINFLYLQHTPHIYKLPILKEINIDLTSLFYPLVQDRKIPNFFWEVLNLLYANEQDRDKIKIGMYQLNFTEKEQLLLERFLGHSSDFNTFFQTFPFKPDTDKALELLKML